VVYEAFTKAGNLVPVKENLIDLSSDDRKPSTPLSQTWVLKQEFTGLNSGDKIAYLRGKMKENQCDCYVVTALDEIAWILNSNPFHRNEVLICVSPGERYGMQSCVLCFYGITSRGNLSLHRGIAIKLAGMTPSFQS
jgi:hypothetical protein